MYEQEICEAFLRRIPWDNVPKKFKKTTKATKGGWGGFNRNLQPPNGTLCLSYQTRQLMSYEHWDLAWICGNYVVVNGDAAPSKRTDIQRRALFAAIRVVGVPSATIPFTTLREAGIEPKYVGVRDVNPDFTITRTRMIKGEKVERKVHFLGECLFSDLDSKRYLSGLDRNDDPEKRMYYLCMLPSTPYVDKVGAALEALRPAHVPVGTPRQGEWFFVPQPEMKVKVTRADVGTPVVSDLAIDQVESSGAHERQNRHVVRYMAFEGDSVFVKGDVRDDEHSTLRLGQVWHKVVRNRSPAGWRYKPQPGVLRGRAEVD